MSYLDDYEPVEDRLRLFWTDHPYGRVITELLHHDAEDYIVQASIYIGNELRNDPPAATGLAHDSAATLPNNLKASALEVCETSAIGRALANLNYAAKGKRPSREEMSKTERPEPVPKRPGLGADGEAALGSGESSGTAPDAGEGHAPSGSMDSSASVPEPHVHEAGPKKLASGKPLCKTCGAPFDPAQTVAV